MTKKKRKYKKKQTKSISKSINGFLGHKKNETIGQWLSDRMTHWAGSWAFIIGFLVFLVIWMAINFYGWIKTWDPYPFILLNLVLSCLAAIQAPIILMSQNRAAERDRSKAERDYQVNRKAERENQQILRDLNQIKHKLKIKQGD